MGYPSLFYEKRVTANHNPGTRSRHVVRAVCVSVMCVLVTHTSKPHSKRIKSRRMVQSSNRQTGPDPAVTLVPENENYDLVGTIDLNHCKTMKV